MSTLKSQVGTELKSSPSDPRFFATVDQALHCWAAYNEWMQCTRIFKSASAPNCSVLKASSIVMCPSDWVSKFSDARERHVWFGLKGAQDESPNTGHNHSNDHSNDAAKAHH